MSDGVKVRRPEYIKVYFDTHFVISKCRLYIIAQVMICHFESSVVGVYYYFANIIVKEDETRRQFFWQSDNRIYSRPH